MPTRFDEPAEVPAYSESSSSPRPCETGVPSGAGTVPAATYAILRQPLVLMDGDGHALRRYLQARVAARGHLGQHDVGAEGAGALVRVGDRGGRGALAARLRPVTEHE